MFRYFFSLLIIIPTLCVANPIDLKMGMTLRDIQGIHKSKVSKIEPFIFKLSNWANKNDSIDYALLVVTPVSGLCQIVLTGKNVNTTISGNELKSIFYSYVSALRLKYGAPSIINDFVPASSPWQNSNEWMIGLMSEKHELLAEWKNNSHFNILRLESFARATSWTSGYIVTRYLFNNDSNCSSEIDIKVNSKGF